MILFASYGGDLLCGYVGIVGLAGHFSLDRILLQSSEDLFGSLLPLLRRFQLFHNFLFRALDSFVCSSSGNDDKSGFGRKMAHIKVGASVFIVKFAGLIELVDLLFI